jgi:hypothetical protein
LFLLLSSVQHRSVIYSLFVLKKQKNKISQKDIFNEIIFFKKNNIFKSIFQCLVVMKNLERQKKTDDGILLLTDRISVTFTIFRLLLPESEDEGRNPVTMTGFQTV